MPVTLRRTKPKIELFDFAYSPNPAKNYIYQVMAQEILNLRPERSLDGGFGELRNLWMFSGQYVGIGLNHAAYFRGLKRIAFRQPGIPARHSFVPPEIYLMRLESDFSFIDPVDLCVSTNTLCYINDKVAVLGALVDRVKLGGALIVEEQCDHLESFIRVLEKHFASVEIQYWGFDGCYFFDAETSLDDVISLSKLEMATPNVREGHENFHLYATGKLSAPGPSVERPEMIHDQGPHIVMKDLASLRSDDEPLAALLRRRGLL